MDLNRFPFKDCIGRTWQCGTIQLGTPSQRFELEYGADGQKRPIMIHRVAFEY